MLLFYHINVILVASFVSQFVRVHPKPLPDRSGPHRHDGNDCRYPVAGGTNKEVHPCRTHKLSVVGRCSCQRRQPRSARMMKDRDQGCRPKEDVTGYRKAS